MSKIAPHRATLYPEKGTILDHQEFAGEQFLLRVEAAQIASTALPGSFVHLQCDPQLPMRRPISIMRASAAQGWIDLLYKRVGKGTNMLAKRKAGEALDLLGPIGKPFVVHTERPRPLLIGGGVGMPPMIFLAEHLRSQPNYQPLVILGSEVPFPFSVQPSQIMIPGIGDGVIGAMPLLDDWGVASRLCSTQNFAGCFNGFVTELAREWLQHLSQEERNDVEIFACGPHPMLEAVANLAQEFDLPCQVSLEEYMACGVGGCAGCAVEVISEKGSSMQRVCVDGPVFRAHEIFPEIAQ